jgi:Zn-finger nucleic acid-binding protein
MIFKRLYLIRSEDMDCPVCKNAMITMELKDIEIDYCTGCKGIWLDAGELELLLGNSAKSKELLGSFKSSNVNEAPRKCPICRKKMEKVTVGRDKPELLLDRCGRGDGLWFDRGELNTVIDKAVLDVDNKIKDLLADMFGQK